MNTFLELLITAGRFIVGLWPLMFLAILISVRKRRKGFREILRSSIKSIVFAYTFFALLNLLFYLLKMDTFHLLPEDINTKYFLFVGLLLMPLEFAVILDERHKRINAETIEEMRALSPSEFETLVAETYQAQGHRVEIVGSTGDHGIDIVVQTRRGETWLVQCKKYRGKIGEPVIRDFYGALRAANADAGAVITTGTITTQARLWAEGKPIYLYDGEEFLKVIQTTRFHRALPPEVKKKRTPQKSVFSPMVLQPAYATPAPSGAKVEFESYPEQDKRPFMNMDQAPDCPACGLPMMLHTQKRFLFKPKQVYICQNAPSCNETLEAG
ncbi:MAG: restriction endonuclease [Chloroflexi bacterium]|nr:restriction endonuclease [Chloroflexota bacterium]